MQSQYLNPLGLYSIDEPVAPDNQLPDLRSPNLRHHSTGLGEALESIRGLEDVPGKYFGGQRRVTSDEKTDGIEVVKCLL